MTTMDSTIDVGSLPEAPGQHGETKPMPRVAPSRRSPIHLLSSLRAKLVIPYVLLTLATAMIGMFVITRLVASTLRERFANQMLEASRVASDSIVRRERVHLEELRLMTFTQGVGPAMAEDEAGELQQILFPLVVNNGVQLLTVASADGQELLSLVDDPETSEFLVSRGADLSQVELLAGPLAGRADELGNKYAGLQATIYGPYLLTAGPVRGGAGEVLGALMIGTRLDSLAAEIKAQVLADVIILDSSGTLMTTTLAAPDEGYDILGLAPYDVAYLNPGKTVELSMYGRPYQVYFTPLLVRHKAVGVLGVVLPSNFIVTAESISRNVFILLFTLGTLAVIITGLVLASRISRPIVRMRDVSLAVAAGDLEQRTGVRGRDEVGQMAAVFDLMTFRLRRRTAQATRLHAEAVRRSEELAEANVRLQQAQQQLVQSEKLAAVGTLAAGIVHDIKNPLAVISGLTEELQEGLTPESAIAMPLTQIRENAVRASGIVTDLLKFARQSNPEKRYQNVWDTVRTAVRLNDYLSRRANVRVGVDLTARPVMTMYDAQQIEQVLVNLIQNAVHAMTPQGGLLSLVVRAVPPWVEIEIRDTGVGISAKNLGRIFDPFFTTKPPGEGTGLGLSVSYGIVAQHQGQIDVRSQEGRGSTFVVRLPLRNPDDKTLA
ncbi:MAG TPA: ATP-binding protein [Anaerolineales bacterium]|nr:ATP-binding protein [Anaerolineales bacterium]